MPPRSRAATAAPRPTALDGSAVRAIREKLLAWYDAEGRDLPFRGTTDPWAILVSEAMAQQTQVSRAGQAWVAFMARFPTPAALATASPADCLRAWRGLGYNRRALALQRAATAIVTEHGGEVPADLTALERLPGVGPYTARAVGAIAFGLPVGAVDTNVRRVLTRLVGSEAVATAPRIQALADEIVDPDRPGDWTHAVMDLGAGVCQSAAPHCSACPLRDRCATAAAIHTATRSGAPAAARAAGTGRRRPRVAAERALPFRSSSRWLRGRIIDRLRDAPAGDWTRFDGPIGQHRSAAVATALDGLARDGLVERHDGDPSLARLPVHPR